MQTRLGSFVECVLTTALAVCFASCSNPGPPPNPLPTQVASPVVPSTTATPSPSAEELKLHEAEGAVVRFWRVIDRLSADPDSDLTELTTVSRGSVAATHFEESNRIRFEPTVMAQELATSVELLAAAIQAIPLDRLGQSDAKRLGIAIERPLEILRQIRRHLRREI